MQHNIYKYLFKKNVVISQNNFTPKIPKIDLIFARIKHPQTNGKIEKWFDIYQKHRCRFNKLDDFINWYNNKKPHMSLRFNKAETPSEAFIRKMRTEVWLGFVKGWF